jgi:hypothetical protein
MLRYTTDDCRSMYFTITRRYWGGTPANHGILGGLPPFLLSLSVAFCPTILWCTGYIHSKFTRIKCSADTNGYRIIWWTRNRRCANAGTEVQIYFSENVLDSHWIVQDVKHRVVWFSASSTAVKEDYGILLRSCTPKRNSLKRRGDWGQFDRHQTNGGSGSPIVQLSKKMLETSLTSPSWKNGARME